MSIRTQIRRAAQALFATGVLATAVLATSGVASAQALPGPVLPPPLQTIDVRPDLTVTLTDSPDPVPAGQPFSYTMTVRNVPAFSINGQPRGDTANIVQVRQVMPQGVSPTSVSATGGLQCFPTAFDVICSGGPLVAGGVATVTVRAVAPTNPGVTSGGHIVSTATVDPFNLVAERNEANNTASADTLIPLNSFF
jgi:hypothetical protein